MAKPKNDIPTERLEQYERVVATIDDLPRKGAAVPYTALNGHMFSYMNAEGQMALKLPKGQREAFLEKYQTKLFEAYGIVQKEFVTVPDALLADTDDLSPYFRMSYDYVASLKPKPTKKGG
jgi:hypothetical protein